MEAIGETIKFLVENYLIQFVVSLISGFVLFLLVPTDSVIILKLGKNTTITFLSIACFGVILLVTKTIGAIRSRMAHENYKKERDKKRESKAVEGTFDFVDSLSIAGRKRLDAFIASDNKSILIKKYEFSYEPESLFSESSNAIHIRKVEGENGELFYEVKLNEKLYNNLLYCKNKYGRISRFE